MARLSEQDRARVRHHLGYLNVQPVATIQLGFPAASQPQFLVELAMDRVMDAAVDIILRDLNTLDEIECRQIDSLKRLKVQALGELKLRNSNEEPNEHDLLAQTYEFWKKKLANDLGVPVNPFAEAQGVPLNIPVAIG